MPSPWPSSSSDRIPTPLVIVTGDHETGGLSVTNARTGSHVAGRDRVVPHEPELQMIAGITLSLDAMATRLGDSPSPDTLDRLLTAHFPGFTLDSDLRQAIVLRRALEHNFGEPIQNALGRMISRQTGFYWGTSGHTNQPVAVGALGPGAERFRGYFDNTEFARRLRALLAP